MASLKEVIQREVNPFDSSTFRTGNFWTENNQAAIETVESIHQEAIEEITEILNLVAKDHRTRTVLLAGDSGCGKSYSLGRLKKNLNSKAFFAYIDPAPSSDCIWQHTLRYTLDSLIHIPEGEKESQLLLWLKSLYAFNADNFKKKLLGQKRNFIQEMRATYPAGIYQPRDFFAVLYELTDPKNYFLACDWLRGDNLDRDDLRTLGINSVIDSEQAARGILGNFGRISKSNLPIVLCFDQVELAPTLPDGSPDISWAFKINTALHNNNLKNFLVILSVVTEKLKAYWENILLSDQARIDKEISLKRISLKQVEALWASRISFLHSQIDNKLESAIAPLDKQRLNKKYPSGKANLRDALNFGGKLFLEYKLGRSPDDNNFQQILAAFKLLWSKELNKTQTNITRIRQFSSQELIEILQQAMNALQIHEIKPRFLSGRNASYSFSCQLPGKTQKLGILWNEEPNLNSFSAAMRACKQATRFNPDHALILIRAERLGRVRNQGYKLFQKIFQGSSHRHITPHLNSIQYLKTYQRLANDARAGDLVVGFETPNLQELQALVRESKVLHECSLFQDLGIVDYPDGNDKGKDDDDDINFKAKELLLNIVTNQHFLGRQILIEQAKSQFPNINDSQFDRLIQELCQENKIKILDPKAKPKEQLICMVPQKQEDVA